MHSELQRDYFRVVYYHGSHVRKGYDQGACGVILLHRIQPAREIGGVICKTSVHLRRDVIGSIHPRMCAVTNILFLLESTLVLRCAA